MLPKIHIIFGAIISIIIYLVFNLNLIQAGLIFFASFLIDFDHYFYYIFLKKDFSLKNAYCWYIKKMKILLVLPKKERETFKKPIFIFHGIEFWFLLIIFYFFNKIIFFILVGILTHMILDFLELIYIKESLYSKFSQIYTSLKNKNKTSLLKI